MPAAVLLVAAVAAGGSRTCGERPRPPPSRSSRGSGPAGAGVSAARAVAEAGRETPLCGRLFFTVSHWRRKAPPFPFLLLLDEVTFCMLDEIESESDGQSLLARSAKKKHRERERYPAVVPGFFFPSLLFRCPCSQGTNLFRPPSPKGLWLLRRSPVGEKQNTRPPAKKKEGGGPRRRNGRSPPPPPVSAKWSAVALPPPPPSASSRTYPGRVEKEAVSSGANFTGRNRKDTEAVGKLCASLFLFFARLILQFLFFLDLLRAR